VLACGGSDGGDVSRETYSKEKVAMFVKPPVLIIVSGFPGAGKTTLARLIGERCSLPVIYKDKIKEKLCDELGCTSLEESQRLGKTAMSLLYQFAGAVLQAGQACIIEANFHPNLAQVELHDLQGRYPFVALEIHCHADLRLCIERYQRRLLADERHPVHMDQLRLTSVQTELSLNLLSAQPVGCGDHLIEVDTTDFLHIDYDALFTQIQYILMA
jgi:predicted kinase